MFGKLGLPELILILVIALMIFGPAKLPEIGKSIGKGIREFKNASKEMKKGFEDDEASKEQADEKKQNESAPEKE